EMLRGSATHEIIRRAGDISVHVVPEQLTRALKGAAPRPQPQKRQASSALDVKAYAASLAMVTAGLLVGLLLRQVGITNVALVFLTSVLVTAITFGLWPSLFACVVATLCYNFFFLPPLYTFTIADPENVVALFFFSVVAVIASNLASRVRAEALTARERAAATENLYLFSRKLAGVIK